MEKLCFVLLQADGVEIIGTLIKIILVTLVFLGIFLIIRTLVLWYWKVDVIVRNQEEQIALAKYQNQLIEYQTEILKELKTQMQNNGVDPNKQELRS
jgi:hypothetical protein